MKIALIQQRCSDNRIQNIETGLELAERAAASGAGIICFAELAFDKFFPQKIPGGDIKHLAEPIPGPTTEKFSGIAKKLRTVIILNIFEIENGSTYDTSPVIGPDGKILGKTRMVHIPDYTNFHEKHYYSEGDLGARIFNTQMGKIGIAICYDRHFPEYMRMLGINGAEIVFTPQAGAEGEWPEGLFEAEMRVAAFQNGYYTALCNRVGKEGNLNFSGESFVCSHTGEVIARASAGTDEILYCDLDLETIRNSHARNLFFKDRRTDLNKDWFR